MACNGCQKGLKALVNGKLGRCPKCMRWSALGTLLSWVALLCIYFVLPNPYLLGLTLLVATSFTLLWLSHIVALTLRAGSTLKAVRHTEGKPNLSRREFVPALGRLAFLGFVSVTFGSKVLFARGNCDDRFRSNIENGVIGKGCECFNAGADLLKEIDKQCKRWCNIFTLECSENYKGRECAGSVSPALDVGNPNQVKCRSCGQGEDCCPEDSKNNGYKMRALHLVSLRCDCFCK